jgi:hypothetical protein
MSLNNLSVRYGEVGRRAEGLATIEEAVAIQRRPAAASPDAYEPDLAMSLWASACVRVGLQTDLRTAFDCARESASMYRMWAERVPGMFTDKLRAVLTVAADVLAGLERDEDNEAIRRLSEEDGAQAARTMNGPMPYQFGKWASPRSVFAGRSSALNKETITPTMKIPCTYHSCA